MPKGYDPKNSAFSSVQYVTDTANSEAFRTAYGITAQPVTKLNPKGVRVQAGGAAWA